MFSSAFLWRRSTLQAEVEHIAHSKKRKEVAAGCTPSIIALKKQGHFFHSRARRRLQERIVFQKGKAGKARLYRKGKYTRSIPRSPLQYSPLIFRQNVR
jgi:hypothetical protein